MWNVFFCYSNKYNQHKRNKRTWHCHLQPPTWLLIFDFVLVCFYCCWNLLLSFVLISLHTKFQVSHYTFLKLSEPNCTKFAKHGEYQCFTLLFQILDKLLQFEMTATKWRRSRECRQNHELFYSLWNLGQRLVKCLTEFFQVQPRCQHLIYVWQGLLSEFGHLVSGGEKEYSTAHNIRL